MACQGVFNLYPLTVNEVGPLFVYVRFIYIAFFVFVDCSWALPVFLLGCWPISY